MSRRWMPALAALLLAAPAPAADPAPPALSLTLRKPGVWLPAVWRSPMGEWLRASPAPVYKALAADLDRSLSAARDLVPLFGVTWPQLRDGVLSGTVTLEFTPDPGGNPERDSVTLVAEVADPAVVEAVLKRVNDYDLGRGEVSGLKPLRSPGGRKLTERAKPAGRSEYYALTATHFVWSLDRAAAESALDAPPPPGQPGGAQAEFRLTPRAFDAALAARSAKPKDDAEAAFLAQFARVWGALDAAELRVELADAATATLDVRLRAAVLPPEFAALAGDPAPSTAPPAPQSAWLSLSVRLTPKLWLDAAESLLAPAQRGELRKAVRDALGPAIGKGNIDALLAGAGPTWALAAETPPGASPWPALSLVVELADPSLPTAVLAGVDTLAQLWRYDFNRSHDAQLEWRADPATQARRVSGAPTGAAPEVHYAAGRTRFAAATDAGRLATALTATAPAPAEAFKLVVKVAGLREFLAQRPAKSDEVQTWLDVLSAFARLDLTVTPGPNRVRVAARLEFAAPLLKQ